MGGSCTLLLWLAGGSLATATSAMSLEASIIVSRHGSIKQSACAVCHTGSSISCTAAHGSVSRMKARQTDIGSDSVCLDGSLHSRYG